MKNINIKNLLLILILACAMSACSYKGAATPAGTSTDSAARAKEDSISAAEGKEAKDALDAVKR